MKRILTLDSHSLSNYQQCPQLYNFTTIRNIEPAMDYAPFVKGTIIAKWLADYYELKKAGNLTSSGILDLIDETLKGTDLPDIDLAILHSRFMQYHKHYRNETWIPIAMEQGFSKTLYEDDEVLFIYEGRPDFIVHSKELNSLIVVDHKSQSRVSKLNFYNNQNLGYCWAVGTTAFSYNIFGVQEVGDPELWFQRPGIIFDSEMILKWKFHTVQWFYRILEDSSFNPSWQCDGKYGICRFQGLCRLTHDISVEAKIKQEFKQRKHKAW